MRLSDFVLLSPDEKKEALLQHAVLVAKRSEPGSIFLLFQLGAYYVEATCNTESREVDAYHLLPGTDQLDAYLATIPLDALLR